MRHFLKGIIIILIGLTGTLMFSCSGDKQTDDNKQSGDSTETRLRDLSNLIRKYPDKAENYFERANYYIGKKDAENAKKDIDKAISLDSTNASYYLTRCDVYFALNQTRVSKESLEKCIELDPKNSNAHLRLAELFLYVKQHKESIEAVDQALMINKYNAKAYFIKGMNFKEMGDTSRAINSFQTVVEQDPDYYHAYIQLGLLWAAKKNKLAVDYYNNALRLNPKSAEAFYNLAMYYQETAQYNLAIQTYNTLLALKSDHKNAMYNIGYIIFETKGDYKEAMVWFDRAYDTDPNYAEAVYMRGVCAEALGMRKEAKADYTQALHLKEDFELAFEGLKRIDRK